MNEIIVAIVSGLCVAIPSLIATISSNKRNMDLTLYRISELEKKQDKHNSIIERTYKLEADVGELKEEIRAMKG